MDIMAARVVLIDGFTLQLGGEGPGASVVDLPRAVQRLVAYVGLSHRPARTAVAGQLWPDVSDARAQSSLRSALWRLQKAAPGLLDASAGTLTLARGVRVDVHELTSWAERVLDPRFDVDEVVLPGVVRSGELLPGWYDDWVLLQREHLRQLRLPALEVLAVKLGRAGRYGEAVQAAHAAVRAEPLRETAHRVLVRIHLAEGNVAEALRAYESFRTVLLEELGVAPTSRMEALISSFRRAQPVRALFPAEPRRPAEVQRSRRAGGP
jgi:DNA-binding SARP family transcriptional activator